MNIIKNGRYKKTEFLDIKKSNYSHPITFLLDENKADQRPQMKIKVYLKTQECKIFKMKTGQRGLQNN